MYKNTTLCQPQKLYLCNVRFYDVTSKFFSFHTPLKKKTIATQKDQSKVFSVFDSHTSWWSGNQQTQMSPINSFFDYHNCPHPWLNWLFRPSIFPAYSFMWESEWASRKKAQRDSNHQSKRLSHTELTEFLLYCRQ